MEKKFEPVEKTLEILQLAQQVHEQARIDFAEGRKLIPRAQIAIEKVRGEARRAEREDVAQFCGTVEVYLNSLASRADYHSVLSASLDTLSRRAALVRD